MNNNTLPGSIRITPPSLPRDGSSLGKRGRSITEKATSPQGSTATIGFKVCRGAEIVCWATAGLSAFTFAIMVVTPILVPLLSFGSIFSEGWNEWLDFTMTAWKMSVNPALLGVIAVALAFSLRKGKVALESRLSAENEKGYELRRLEGLIKPN